MENQHLISEIERASIAEVRLNQKNKRIDLPYDYLIPDHLLESVRPGVRAVVPFGTGSRVLEGFVTAVKKTSDYGEALRSIQAVIDDEPVLTEAQSALCDWLHRYYFSLFYEALALFTAPVKVVHKRKKNEAGIVTDAFEVYAPKRMASTAEQDACDCSEKAIAKDSVTEHKALFEAAAQTDDPVFYENADPKKRFETYCDLAEAVRQSQGQTLMLLPDLFTLHAFQPVFDAYFGSQGCIYSGDLKPSARYRIFQRVRRGEVSVVLGTRAALFLPYTALSLIIQDEPDDSAYFARSMPRYDTLRVVQEYSKISGAKYLLGGSVLSLQIYAGICTDHVRHFKPNVKTKPAIEIVDMQSEMRRGNLDFISGCLKFRMEETIERGEKVLLMLNKRGMAGYMLCRQCGHVEKCSKCGISLKPHEDGKLHCPYCGMTKIIPDHCPACHSKRFRPVGLGIEKAAAVMKQRYPQWRILQLDAQLLSDAEALSEFRSRLDHDDWDVIIGTRFLLKGWNFRSVGLTAALLMDESLNHGDYNDSEKALLLFRRFFALSQRYAIGQTYEPNHDVVTCLSHSGEPDFYQNEIAYRKMMHYPPMCHLAIFSVMEQSKDQAAQDAAELYQALSVFKQKMPGGQFFQIYQPVLAGIQPKTGRIRYKIMVKISQIGLLHQITNALITSGGIEKLKSKVSIEIDPSETR